MPMFETSPYRKDVFTIKQYGENIVKITYNSSLRESGWEDTREHTKKCTVNIDKLDNNKSRARNKVKEYALCNDWEYFITFTIDKEKCDRYNLDNYVKKVSKLINNYNFRRTDNDKVVYLLVPEQHKDGAWHMHGLIKGLKSEDIGIILDDFGVDLRKGPKDNRIYYYWKQYHDKFGFMSMTLIESKEKISSYIMKYMTKECQDKVKELGAHTYYASKGLNTAQELYRGSATFKGQYDWEHEEGYIKIKMIDIRETDLKDLIDYEL